MFSDKQVEEMMQCEELDDIKYNTALVAEKLPPKESEKQKTQQQKTGTTY